MTKTALLFFLVSVAGQDRTAEYREKLARVCRNAAAGHANLGVYLAGEKMHRWARDEFRRAVALDPECADAQTRLGNKKIGGKWEFDADKPIPTTNQAPEAKVHSIRDKYREKRREHGKKYGAEFVSLAEWCEKNGLKEETKGLNRKAMLLDPSNAKARAALGFALQGDKTWQSGFEREVREGLSKAPKGTASTLALDVDRLDLKLRKHEGDHFLAASPHLSQGDLESLIQHTEHTYATWKDLFREDPFQKTKMQLLLFQDKKQHESYIEEFDNGAKAQKEFRKGLGGIVGYPRTECWQGNRPLESLEDYVVHATAQMLQRTLSVGKRDASHDPLWLTEGMAYYFTRLLMGTTTWGCVALGGTKSEGSMDPQHSKNWFTILRTQVETETDPEIRAVIQCTKYADLAGFRAVKAWSLIDFLLAEHREKFVAFCKDLKAAEDNGESSFQKVFGWSLDELNTRWREYARWAYAAAE